MDDTNDTVPAAPEHGAHRLSSVPISDLLDDDEGEPPALLMSIRTKQPWFADIVNYLVAGIFPSNCLKAKKDKFRHDARYYVWDDPFLWKHCADRIDR